jgi:alkylhydroperoxidase family enzyme
VSRADGISFEKIAALESFESSPFFNDAEKAALRMTEAMCERSVTVPDGVFEQVRKHFDDRAIVELVAMVALENMRARFNRALEIPSDEICQLPANHPAIRATAAGS